MMMTGKGKNCGRNLPAEKPELVVACIVEQGGFGTSAAGPIVYKVFEEWFRQEGFITDNPAAK